MKSERPEKRVCEVCGKEYRDYPALSRVDNKTLICPDCGILEALESIGLSKEEQQKILKTIHKHTREN